MAGNFDNFHDIKARQMLSAFAADKALVLVLVHIEIDEKSNEIPAAQLLEDSTWQALSSPATRCTVKKTFEAADAANAHLIVQTQGQPAGRASNGRGRCATAMPLSSASNAFGRLPWKSHSTCLTAPSTRTLGGRHSQALANREHVPLHA
jgi:hypothetical protein